MAFNVARYRLDTQQLKLGLNDPTFEIIRIKIPSPKLIMFMLCIKFT